MTTYSDFIKLKPQEKLDEVLKYLVNATQEEGYDTICPKCFEYWTENEYKITKKEFQSILIKLAKDGYVDSTEISPHNAPLKIYWYSISFEGRYFITFKRTGIWPYCETKIFSTSN